jgi:uncharacterized repeat protein (TIGR03803 family)
MRPRFPNPFRSTSLWLIAGLLTFSAADGVSAYTLKTLRSFCATAGCKDGIVPLSGLLADSAGDLYGTTELGGVHNAGVAFELVPNANKTKWTEHLLHAFCSKPSCTDGQQPAEGNLIMDVNGNIYGTTQAGGKFNYGEIFRLTHTANGWALKVLHSFDYNNGAAPLALTYVGQSSGALWDAVSPLFGTAFEGSDANDDGLAYEFVINGTTAVETVIHRFTTAKGPNDLLADSAGNLYGTTLEGGKYGSGILYKLANGRWHQSILHNFCTIQDHCAAGPAGRLVMDGSGNLFGVTRYGGANSSCANNDGCGTVFEFTNGTFDIIYNFCPVAGCADGSSPLGGVILDTSGHLFGTTSGNATLPSTVFELQASGGSWFESVLYTFCSQLSCTDGNDAGAPLIMDSSGDLFGTTSRDGANGDGTVFELKP